MALPGSAFTERLLRLNGLEAAGFDSWELLPGMAFGEHAAWWRDGVPRDGPHEGLDLRSYSTSGGRSVPLEPGALVPVLWAGTVAAVAPDFLGRSVFVAHDGRDEAGRRLHSVYGHLDPRPGLEPGCTLCEGEELGAVADPAARNSSVPSHLHLTVAWIADAPGMLDWRVLHDPARAVLIDPLPFVCATMPPPQRA
jgi:hypothetical protein